MTEELKTFIIPNDLCRRSGLAATWRPINGVGVFGYVNKKVTLPDKPSDFAPCDTPIFNLRQEFILDHPILRKLVNESNGIFLTLQAVAKIRFAEVKRDLLQVSRQYRSVIRACLENFQEETRNADSIAGEELQNFITIFYSVECIWHLCEILYIDSIPGNVVLPHLLEWVRFHFPKHERNAALMLSGSLVGLDSKPEYWPTIIGCLVQGRVKVARALLRQHSAADSNAFQLMDQVLRNMPLYDVDSGISVSEFDLEWQQWIADTQAKIDARLFAMERNINFIAKLIVGDEATWIEMRSRCDAWYELMAGSLFFVQPTVKSYELSRYAKKCITNMSLKNRMKHLDRVILAAMEFDVLQVIKEIQNMDENGWFVCHLADILYHSGRLEQVGEEIEDFSATKLRESFLLDYGTLFMSHKSLWQVGLSYLDYCSEDGTKAIQLLLPRISFNSEFEARKIIREAQTRGLLSVAQSICKIQGMKSLRRNRLGNALTWALKSHDNVFTSYLADKFLREYTKTGKFTSIDLLDNLGSCMLASDRLIFLGKYYEFHKLYQAAKFREAGNLLISLMSSKIIPAYFWSVLLMEAIPLLESEDIVFSSNDTFTILHCLQEREDLVDLKDEIDLLRLAASRNLARTLMYEAQHGF